MVDCGKIQRPGLLLGLWLRAKSVHGGAGVAAYAALHHIIFCIPALPRAV
jgi:hypothetical protein